MKLFLTSGSETREIEIARWSRSGNHLTAAVKGGIIQEPRAGGEFTAVVQDDLEWVVQPDIVVTVQGYNAQAVDTNGVVTMAQNDLVFQIKGGVN
jgi:hypothetical protein